MLAFVFVFIYVTDRLGLLLLRSQGYHTGVVMEERCTREVSDRDAAIEALKVENERLVGEKGGLTNSLAALRVSLAEKEKETEVSKADLAKATEQARKANELCEGLRRELASEKESAAAVGEQLTLTLRRLDSVKGVLAATVSHYRTAVAEFGGETSAPPEGDNVYALASWLKRHLAKLPDLMNGCTDYGALAGVTNYAKLLSRGGCTHTESILGVCCRVRRCSVRLLLVCEKA